MRYFNDLVCHWYLLRNDKISNEVAIISSATNLHLQEIFGVLKGLNDFNHPQKRRIERKCFPSYITQFCDKYEIKGVFNFHTFHISSKASAPSGSVHISISKLIICLLWYINRLAVVASSSLEESLQGSLFVFNLKRKLLFP